MPIYCVWIAKVLRIAISQPLSKLALRYSGFEELRKWRLRFRNMDYFRCYCYRLGFNGFHSDWIFVSLSQKHRLAAYSPLSQCSSGW